MKIRFNVVGSKHDEKFIQDTETENVAWKRMLVEIEKWGILLLSEDGDEANQSMLWSGIM